MQRREFLAASGVAAVLGGSQKGWCTGVKHVQVVVDRKRRYGAIPTDFLGLGYEISSVAIPDFLSGRNRTYVQLVRTLSRSGVIRIGGNTSDDSSFVPDGEARAAPKGTVVNSASFQQLGTFLQATDWKLIWGLNLGTTGERQAVEEAEAVAAAAKDRLLAFEIGNEVDLFRHNPAHRPPGYGYEEYLADYRRFKAAIRAKLPQAPFAGPDVASATDWATKFAADEGNDLKLLTHHYYRECASATSTLAKLLYPDPKLAPELDVLKSASLQAKVPYRICETNSFCGGGKPGVSDTFGAALWVLDFLFTLASQGCSGVNIETGVNQLGVVSSYSPIRQREGGDYFAAPDYYGMLAFAQGSRGEQVGVDCDPGGINLTAYAVESNHGGLTVTVINKESAVDAEVSLVIPGHLSEAKVLRLRAPSLASKEGVTFGGAGVDASGAWKPVETAERIRVKGRRAELQVLAGTAAVVMFV